MDLQQAEVRNPPLELAATARTKFGKGFARKLRQQGRIPAVLARKGQPSLALTVCPIQATQILHKPHRRNGFIELNLQDDAQGASSSQHAVMVQDVQVHPVKRVPIHIDFVQVDANKPMQVRVPVRLQGRSKQVVAGAKLRQLQQTMRVACLPQDVPHQIDIDITDLPLGHLRAQQVALPERVQLNCDPQLSVINIWQTSGQAKADSQEEASS
ncbi:MAG: 50S ribosomal protein L25 [Myxococcota bacterium]